MNETHRCGRNEGKVDGNETGTKLRNALEIESLSREIKGEADKKTTAVAIGRIVEKLSDYLCEKHKGEFVAVLTKMRLSNLEEIEKLYKILVENIGICGKELACLDPTEYDDLRKASTAAQKILNELNNCVCGPRIVSRLDLNGDGEFSKLIRDAHIENPPSIAYSLNKCGFDLNKSLYAEGQSPCFEEEPSIDEELLQYLLKEVASLGEALCSSKSTLQKEYMDVVRNIRENIEKSVEI